MTPPFSFTRGRYHTQVIVFITFLETQPLGIEYDYIIHLPFTFAESNILVCRV